MPALADYVWLSKVSIRVTKRSTLDPGDTATVAVERYAVL